MPLYFRRGGGERVINKDLLGEVTDESIMASNNYSIMLPCEVSICSFLPAECLKIGSAIDLVTIDVDSILDKLLAA